MAHRDTQEYHVVSDRTVSQRTIHSKFLKLNVFPNSENIVHPSLTTRLNISFKNKNLVVPQSLLKTLQPLEHDPAWMVYTDLRGRPACTHHSLLALSHCSLVLWAAKRCPPSSPSEMPDASVTGPLHLLFTFRGILTFTAPPLTWVIPTRPFGSLGSLLLWMLYPQELASSVVKCIHKTIFLSFRI